MISLAHKFVNLRPSRLSERRPSRDEFVGINWDSSQANGLVACFPMWGQSSGAEVDIVGGITAYYSNALYVYDEFFGWVYQGDQGGVPRGGGASTIGRFAKVFTYPWAIDPGFQGLTSIPPRSFSMSAWYRALSYDGYVLLGTDIGLSNAPPNAYLMTFDVPNSSFPGWGFAVSNNNTANSIYAEWDVDGGTSQATIIGLIPLNDGNWHHICCVYDYCGTDSGFAQGGVGQASCWIYVDGVVDVTDKNGGAGGTGNTPFPGVESPLDIINNPPFACYIGADDDGKSAQMNGRFCDMRFYMRALTQSDINAMVWPDSRWELYQPSQYYSVQSPPPPPPPLKPLPYVLATRMSQTILCGGA